MTPALEQSLLHCHPITRKDQFSKQRSPLKLVPYLLLPLLVVHVGFAEAATDSDQRTLTAHVQFLAQPKLKGRKPGSHGSRLARRYIEEQFKSYGLIPWGGAKSFEQSFGYGKNIVGFLPGSDPVLAKEFLLVSAHYDHLGRDAKGKICPGAADNASGVAALLETARQMSSLRPGRSILFVAFDCEEMMLLGSFAFSSQKDVREANIVAVVNVDMVGRDFFDVVHHTLFVVGTERYPELRADIKKFGSQAHLDVLPLGTDLIGPRSDHVAFEPRHVPCLFFSSGTFRDYHQPGDTADRLNYEDLKASADVIRDTVVELANVRALEQTSPAGGSYSEELQAVAKLMGEVNQDLNQAGVQPEDADSFKQLATEANQLLAQGGYDRQRREQLIVDATGILAPYFMPMDSGSHSQTNRQQAELRLAMQYLQQVYFRHSAEMTDAYRRLVVQLLKYHPGIVRGMPKFHFEIYDLSDDDISLTPVGQGDYALHALANCWSMSAEVKSSKWLINSFNSSMDAGFDGLDCKGTKQEIEDFCLLRMSARQDNEIRFNAVRKLLGKVRGSESVGSFKSILAERLQRGGFKDQNEWIANCIQSPSIALASEAIAAAKTNLSARLFRAAFQVAQNADVRPDIRAAALEFAANHRDRQVVLFLCGLVNDSTKVYRPEYSAIWQKNYPFSDRISVKMVRQFYDRWYKESPDASKTLGDVAQAQLKKLAHKTYGKNVDKWRSWAESHPSLLTSNETPAPSVQ